MNKAAQTMKDRYGADYYKNIGKRGGSVKTKKGFAIDNRTRVEKMLGKPKLASIAGAKGGKISKRTKK